MSSEIIDIELAWLETRKKVSKRFGKAPDLNAALMLIGVQVYGTVKHSWTKEEKQDLMHIAVCHLFEKDGYYAVDTIDEDGWPHYIAIKDLPKMSLEEQENLLKKKVINFFDQIDF